MPPSTQALHPAETPCHSQVRHSVWRDARSGRGLAVMQLDKAQVGTRVA